MAKNPQRDVRETIRKIFQARSTLPSLDDLVGNLLAEFGGVNAFAREFKKTYDKTESAMVKARLLEGMNRLILMSAGSRKPPDLSQMSDEEIEQACMLAMEAMGDGDSEPASPGRDGSGARTDAGTPAGAGEKEAGEAEEGGSP